MDKNAIKKYAVWARRELIERVAKKAQQYGIEENTQVDTNADSVNGKLLTSEEKKERQALIAQINDKGYEQVMEEVAYTWFNRFSALRFMEVNGYLPTHVRVFTDEENNFKPQILAEAIHLELDGLDMEKVYDLKEANKTDELYKYLLITQCNALNSILPGMFQKIADYTELLLPDNLIREGSVIEQMITLIPEDDWKDAVQIIGWLYQYYNSEKKDEVFAALKKNVKITKENIPAATQLFTPDWIVRYMVENSLGRLWVEGHPNDELKSNWKYYLDEAQQEADVQAQLDKIREEYKELKPEDIKCIDPCCGSGHILAYMFDVLIQIYEAYGYTSREAVASIVENNIYGLDIDDRAAQLANFAVMMKARQYDHRFFSRKDENGNLAIPQPNVYAICESNHISKECLDYFANGDAKLSEEIHALVDEMHDAKEYGSILNISEFDFDVMVNRFDEIEHEAAISMLTIEAINNLLPVVQVAKLLAQKYDAVVTNPPYMGSRKSMSSLLKKFVEKEYPDSKSDLYAVFIEKCISLTKKTGLCSMVTQQSFMFTDDYKELRSKILGRNHFVNMIHLGADAFPEINGEVVQTSSFVIRAKIGILKYKALYSRLVDFSCNEKEKRMVNKSNLFLCSVEEFANIKAMPFSYWLSDKMRKSFDIGEPFEVYGNPRAGITTGENDRFMRNWFEVDWNRIGIGYESVEAFHKAKKLYIPYNKGGKQIRWYGNNDYVLKFDETNYAILSNQGNHLPSRQYYCQKCMTWSDISGRSFAARYCDKGTIFDVKGSCGFPAENNFWLSLAFLNSKLTPRYIDSLNPTTTTQVGDLKRIPVIVPEVALHDRIDMLAKDCIAISKYFYDMTETSWDFYSSPLVSEITKNKKISEKESNFGLAECYKAWDTDCNACFKQLKDNEEELNRIFIEIYGLRDELTPEVEDKDVTVHKADIQRDIKLLISYAVGCMFGRYSLDIDGLAYSGGEWDSSKYKTYPADKDNIIPICDDEYFEDDIVGRFVKFIEIVYGKGTLEENLKFIADALGGKGSPREVIRNYFLNDFFNDHCKIYQKRPIYWQFDSGKKNGFKCLIYMHRYQPDTIMRIRTDYVHEQQSRYRTAITDLETHIADASTSERVKLNKQLSKLQGQADEVHAYEEKIHHLADQMIRIDLDDGVKHNYAIFQDVLAKIK